MKPKNILKILLFLVFFGLLFIDIYYSTIYLDRNILWVIMVGVLLTKIYKFKSSVTFSLSLIILCLYWYYVFFNENLGISNRLITWIYIILLFGLIQQFIELRYKK